MSKRSLSELEIESICDLIKTKCPNDFIVENSKEQLRLQLKSIQIYPSQIPKLKQIILKQYESSLISPGEMVGCIASTSIGETTTQASLNSFHSSGQMKAGLTTGVARLTELLNASKNIKTPSLTIYFNDNELDVKSLTKVREFCHTNIQQLSFGACIQSTKIETNPSLDKWYSIFSKIYNTHYEECDTRLRVHINLQKCWLHKVDLITICKKIAEECASKDCLKFVFSPDYMGIIDIWCNSENLPAIESILGLKQYTEEEIEKVKEYVEDKKGIYFLKRVVLPSLQKIYIKGLPEVEKCYYTKCKNDDWMIETKGGFMKDLLRLTEINHKKSFSNNMWEILECLGVEATVQFLHDEFGKQLKVSKRHLDIMINWMTNNGSISSVNRYGMDIKKVGPFGKASFEQPLDAFFDAAHNAQVDDLLGVSASIATGKLSKMGTGSFDLILDSQFIEDHAIKTIQTKSEIQSGDYTAEYEDEILEIVEECSDDDEEMLEEECD